MKSWVYWVMMLMIFSGSSIGFFISGNYKAYGKEHFNNDKYLTTAGSVSAVANGIFRPFWAGSLDWIKNNSFKKVYAVNIGI